MPNDNLRAQIYSSSSTSLQPSRDPISEHDYHANMVVIGANCLIFEWSGRTCEVNHFTATLESVNNFSIVDAAIAYDCPYTHHIYFLLCYNALYVPSMQQNLFLTFIIR